MVSRSVFAVLLILFAIVIAYAHAEVNVEDPYGGKPSKPSKPSRPTPTPKPKPMTPGKPSKPTPKPKPKPPTQPKQPHMGSTGVNSGKGKVIETILPGVPTPSLPHVNPTPKKTPVPVQAGTCSGTCQDANTKSCSTGYLTGLCPGAANIKCCPAAVPPPPSGGGGSSSSDSAVMTQVQTQQNTRVSVGSYTGVPNGFYQTKQGALVYQGKMDTDCDGAPSCPSIDPYGQTSTSFTYQGKPIDALKVNYVVLPSDLARKLGSKIKLGDIVAVGYQGKVSYAVYADNGPLGKAGEGSVHLTQELGFNPYCGSKICRGISSGVSYVVFPGSRSQYSSPYDSATIAAAGKRLLRAQVN